MSPVFTPPTVADVPQVLEYDPEKRHNPLGYRLMRYFGARRRGVNVFKMSDGTYQRDDQGAGEPYPATDAVPNNALARQWYAGRETVFPLPNPSVVTVYYGGHSHPVTAAEAAALTAAGFGANIT